jgi:putative ABC transport system substrate-binding protein
MAVYGGDPVRDGAVASLARPGGNVTGVTNFATRLAAKRLELLKEVAPTAERVAVLWDPGSPVGALQLAEVQAAAPDLGVEVHPVPVADGPALQGGFASAIRGRTEALLVAPSPLLTRYGVLIAEFTVANRLPAIGYDRALAEAGLLLVYGPELRDLFRRAATYVDKILKGARPAELPVEQPTKFDFVINLKTARALGLTIPASVLQQATELIQEEPGPRRG